jgi:acetyl-CoA C-acetyltransferase
MTAEALIFDAVRTPRGKGKRDGALHHLSPLHLMVGLLRALESRNGLDTSQIEDVIVGCAELGLIHPPVGMNVFVIK